VIRVRFIFSEAHIIRVGWKERHTEADCLRVSTRDGET
jgi:hypothetical protein